MNNNNFSNREENLTYIKQGFHQFLMSQYKILSDVVGSDKAKASVSLFLEEQYLLFSGNKINADSTKEELEELKNRIKNKLDSSDDYSDQEYFSDAINTVENAINLLNKY